MLTELAPGRWKARVLVRDSSGERRDLVRVSPTKLDARGRNIPDRNGTRAVDAVLAAVRSIRVDAGGDLSDSTTVRQLWDKYRTYLIEQGRSQTTIDQYDVAAELFNTAFGGRRLLEVTTSSVEAFLKEIGHAKGPSSMRTGRNVLSGMFRYAVRRDALSVNPVRESELAQNIEAKGRTGGSRDITVDELRSSWQRCAHHTFRVHGNCPALNAIGRHRSSRTRRPRCRSIAIVLTWPTG
ncbi:site-specific integrase [Nocardia sp. NPDC051756]|uniref:site-specific integrase n=1 Tax=Nocardia sp. NPDC051756 TaxID=3154751 RepID=UPI0034167B17